MSLKEGLAAVLTHKDIEKSVLEVTSAFPVAKVSYFGSYAGDNANEDSDLDLLVEFKTDAVSLLTLLDIKYQLEDSLGVPVDVIHSPIPKDSLLKIDNEVLIYAA
ncbi:MAG: nucleotidyltransferase domain-containing protein [Coriobacteriales bacterium]|nr:nucleotidyltransferase domain-containing protein [Coriobacteriales bacterium]